MSLVFRIAGWITFIVGMVILIAVGGPISPQPEYRTLGIIGLIVVLIGIALTIVAGVIAHFQRYRIWGKKK